MKRENKIHNNNPLGTILNLLYPERCLICRVVLSSSEPAPLCPSCGNNFTVTGLICPICERHGSSPGECSCLPNSYPLKGFAALCFYEKQWRDLLHDFKYRKKRSLARPLGAWLGRELDAQTYFNPTIITPIPLHKEREKERGFNQSELLARSAAKELGIPCDNLLERTRNTPSQTMISRKERMDNISGAFRCRQKIARNTVVLLVDDIYSTGSTMKEAASVLKKQGATVFGAAVAYNRRHRF